MAKTLVATLAAAAIMACSASPVPAFQPIEVSGGHDSLLFRMERYSSRSPALSPGGTWVAWYSDSDSLVPGDDNGDIDVFAREIFTGTVKCVSISPEGIPAGTGGTLDTPRGISVSAGGEFIAFVASDGNGNPDVLVRDMKGRSTSLVSVNTSGQPGNGPSLSPSISRDGRFVAFASFASDLVHDDFNGLPDIFVRDLETGVTERISTGLDGEEPDGPSFLPSISWDGRMVSFTSEATNMLPDRRDPGASVYVFDRATRRTSLISISSDGKAANGNSFSLGNSLSGDGRNVLFRSEATNLTAVDTNAVEDLFVRDLASGATIRASLGNGMTESGQGALSGALDFEGRTVAFSSSSDHLVKGDVNFGVDIFVRDLQTGRVEIVSRASNGDPLFTEASDPVISGNGKIVAFSARPLDLLTGRGMEHWQVFVHDRVTKKTFWISDPQAKP